jgi:hypothetical protein
MLQNIQRGSLTLLLAFLSFNCIAYEPYELQPGTRAASMAGVFLPRQMIVVPSGIILPD